jgi:hypothetical protein
MVEVVRKNATAPRRHGAVKSRSSCDSRLTQPASLLVAKRISEMQDRRLGDLLQQRAIVTHLPRDDRRWRLCQVDVRHIGNTASYKRANYRWHGFNRSHWCYNQGHIN